MKNIFYRRDNGLNVCLGNVREAMNELDYRSANSVNQRCHILYEFAQRQLSIHDQVFILTMFWPMAAYRDYDLGRNMTTIDYEEVKKRYAEYDDLLAILDTWEEAWMKFMLENHNCYVGNNETLRNFWALVRDENERI